MENAIEIETSQLCVALSLAAVAATTRKENKYGRSNVISLSVYICQALISKATLLLLTFMTKYVNSGEICPADL